MVYKFNPVSDILGMSGRDDDEAEYYGSGDDYAYDDDDDYYHQEGSGQDDVHDHVGVSMVRDADHILEEYGPGAVEACGVTISQTQSDVVFVITGGQNGDGLTMKKVLETQLVMDIDGKPTSLLCCHAADACATHGDRLCVVRTSSGAQRFASIQD